MTPFGLFGSIHRQCLRIPAGTLHRWLKFNLVGAMGIAVQLGALMVFSRALGLRDLWATALAVEVALLHNFVWHERFTWGETARAKSCKHVFARLIRFNLTNGAISLCGCLVVVWCLSGIVSLPPVVANLMAIACVGILNFVICQRFVFRAPAQKLTSLGS